MIYKWVNNKEYIAEEIDENILANANSRNLTFRGILYCSSCGTFIIR